MKVVILAGGYGSRLSEETTIKPKPLVEIGGRPIIWHIMKIYSHYGFNDFIICLGYKGYQIKEYFLNYRFHDSDIMVDVSNNKVNTLTEERQNWKITLADTGETSMTGGRLLGIKNYLNNDSTFLMTYGDGVADVNINSLLQFHKKHGRAVTVTAAKPPARFGALKIDSNYNVLEFSEKPASEGSYINGGFFVLEKKIFNFIESKSTSFEEHSLKKMTERSEVSAFIHDGFWQPMDTLRDKNHLDSLWRESLAPWKVWE
jgi:glucose-1-phosphate cytidylyltransferase